MDRAQTYDMNEVLIRAVDPRPTQRVLDVACGSGNGALVAGRHDCEVTGVDLIPAWMERRIKFLPVQSFPYGPNAYMNPWTQ